MLGNTVPTGTTSLISRFRGVTVVLFAFPLVHCRVWALHEAQQGFEVNPVPEPARYPSLVLLEEAVLAENLSCLLLLPSGKPSFLFHLGLSLVYPSIRVMLLARPI